MIKSSFVLVSSFLQETDMTSPDGMSVHHHDQIVQGPRQLRGQLGRVLEGLLTGEVEDVRPGHVVVDNGHAGVVAHEGGHGGGRPVDGVGVVGLGPGLQQQRADLGLGGEAGEVETRVVMLVVTSIRVSTFISYISHTTSLWTHHLVLSDI